jgi:hypothetical protein
MDKLHTLENSSVGAKPRGFLMRWLLAKDLDLWTMALPALREHLLSQLVAPICYHRDQRGDERCWYDDLTLYWNLPEESRQPVRLTREEMADRCSHYHRWRSSVDRPALCAQDSQIESARCAQYVSAMSRWDLIAEARKLRQGIRNHRDKAFAKRTVSDDRALYKLVRGGLQADFRLPPANMFLSNCALICSLVDPNDVDLSAWPPGHTSPLANWRPDDGVRPV